MKVFLDTNIVIDYLSGREPFNVNANAIFQLAADNYINIYVSDLTFINVMYILKKYIHSVMIIQDMMVELRKIVNISPTGEDAIDRALNVHRRDFEDAVQYFSAVNCGADYIVSRDEKDFPVDDIPVILPSELLRMFYEQ